MQSCNTVHFDCSTNLKPTSSAIFGYNYSILILMQTQIKCRMYQPQDLFFMRLKFPSGLPLARMYFDFRDRLTSNPFS